MFGRGFAAGASSAVAVFAVYSSLVQPEDERLQLDKHSLSADDDPVTKRLLRGSDIFKYGIPDVGSQTRYYANHALSYDQAKHIPFWVAEHITKENLQGSANRKTSNFKMDPNVTPMFSSMNSDYKGSGWSRGHMNPAADNKFSQEAMDETFYLSNILPQDIDNNMNYWNLMEIYCRDLTGSFGEVRVISGPVMMPNVEEDGKQYVKYEVIGKNKVAAPTHLFKVITVEQNTPSSSTSDSTNPVAVGAFVVPNAKINSDEHPLREYQVSLETLERATGMTLLPNLTRSAIEDLCKWDSCQLKNKAELDLFFISRRIRDAETIGRLEKSWAELEKRNLKPDDNLRNVYNEKRRVLLEKEGQNK